MPNMSIIMEEEMKKLGNPNPYADTDPPLMH